MRSEYHNKSWIPEHHSKLPIRQGDLAVPCITTELITLGAKTVVIWAALNGPVNVCLVTSYGLVAARVLLTLLRIGILMLLYLSARHFGALALLSSVSRRLGTPQEGLQTFCYCARKVFCGQSGTPLVQLAVLSLTLPPLLPLRWYPPHTQKMAASVGSTPCGCSILRSLTLRGFYSRKGRLTDFTRLVLHVVKRHLVMHYHGLK